jgi:hypothetical protein
LHEQQVLDLVDHIYGVVLDASRWIAVQQDLVQLINSRTEGFAEFNYATGATQWNAAIDMLGKWFSDSDNYYRPTDIWSPSRTPLLSGSPTSPLYARMTRCY